MPKLKLIETLMPVAAINREAEREKTARGGMPSAVHIWWSRRSMAAARCVLFASLVDDPSEHPEIFPTAAEQDIERARLIKIAEDLVIVENTSNNELLMSAKKEILRFAEKTLPFVFDPFAGGGTIPVEAHRLGLSSESADLNAVAAIITTVVSDIPARFHDLIPVHPNDELKLNLPSKGAQGFADDVRYYGMWMMEKAQKKIGNMYPKVSDPENGKELDVSAWIWARTIKCPNPSCGCSIPLSSSYDLARKKGHEVWVEPYAENNDVHFRIHKGPNTVMKANPKVGQTAVFKCPVCGQITTDAYVKECGLNHQIQSQLIAIVTDDGKERIYLPANLEHKSAADVSLPQKLPHGKLPNFPRRFSPPSFGLTDYADLFTNRQLVFITTMIDLARNVQDAVKQAAIEKGFDDDNISFIAGGKGALAYAESIRTVLVLTISKLLDRCSNICSWDASSSGSLRNVFSRAAIPMIWDYAEANPFGSASGSFSNSLLRTCEALAVLPTDSDSRTVIADATMPNVVRNSMLSTDLPYYDRASYGDLSDFFYVWLKYGLCDLYPDYFKTDVSPKKEELTAFPYRWNGDRLQANAYYEEGLRISFKNLYESVSVQYPSTVAFFYKGYNAKDPSISSEWEAFVSAICDAGFMFTASWPLARKYEETIALAESRGIPITVVIRKRPLDAPQTTRRSFVMSVKRELPVIIEKLREQVDIMDLRTSIIGQALNIYSRYSKVLDADGSVMKPQTASGIIEQELDMLMSSIYSAVVSNTKEE